MLAKTRKVDVVDGVLNSAKLLGSRPIPRSQLTEVANQKLFFENLASKYQLKGTTDWKKITNKVILDNGGSSILNHYGGSIHNALSSIYPGRLLSSSKYC